MNTQYSLLPNYFPTFTIIYAPVISIVTVWVLLCRSMFSDSCW